MTTYNSYEAAKIANPECEIYQLERNGLFAHCDHHKAELVRFVEFDSAGIKCNPAGHCMTVEEFLETGHKFVEGDICLGQNDNLLVISGSRLVNGWNDESQIVESIDRYVLRAAALEEPEPELTKDDSPQGVISAISNRLHNIGCEHQDSALGEELGSMACDIWGVLPLISNESIQEKKPRTKIEYVKCEFSHAWEALKSFEEGEELYRDKNQTLQTEVVEFVKAASVGGIGYILTYYKADNLYRRIETPMTEREAFVEAAIHELKSGMSDIDYAKAIFDSGKFKLVN
jgi:hypothetical protein